MTGQALDRNISFGMLLRFALPTIASNIFMSIYTAVDGMFVSRLVGQDALSAVNIVMPMVLFSMAIGTMIGSGGTALVAKKLGEGKEREAKENFTLLAITATLLSVALCMIGLAALNPVIIKYPFWKMTAENPQAVYACINYGEAVCPREIEHRSICIDGDIGNVLSQLCVQEVSCA